MSEDEEDALDSYMKTLVVPERFHAAAPSTSVATTSATKVSDDDFLKALTGETSLPAAPPSASPEPPREAVEDEDVDEDDEEEEEEEEAAPTKVILTAADIIRENSKKKEIKKVDHSKQNYPPFRKAFYVEPKEIADASEDAARVLRAELSIQVRGKDPPRAIDTWSQCGLSGKLLDVLKRNSWSEPFAVQRQAVPAIMSGRDAVVVAPTGSGKTLAYVLPMMRHVLDQPPPTLGQGPIGMILAPTRELATQIHQDVLMRFASLLESACLYGGGNLGEQKAQVRRGVSVVVATPGRLIDILSSRGGKNLPLNRVTFVVLDEADRLFDLGFEPQIERVLENVRPDRQTVMFSATFPPHVERLARKALSGKPLHIVVGSSSGGVTSRVSSSVHQIVEKRTSEQEKYQRLLQLLGEWCPKGGNVLIFCDSQVHVDELYASLERSGYSCLTLHGGKDQLDRDFALKDFKSKVKTVMIATGVAGRGLDVADLTLVINYHCPNHLEEYVHRVGRTGRAGRTGTAVTFFDPVQDARYASDLVAALTASGVAVPEFLATCKQAFQAKVDAGTEHRRKSGYSTRGFSFQAEVDDATGNTALAKRVKVEQMVQLQQRQDPSPEPETGGLLPWEEPGRAEALEQQQPRARPAVELTPSTMVVLHGVTPSLSAQATVGAAVTRGGQQIIARPGSERFNPQAAVVPMASVASLSESERKLLTLQAAKQQQSGAPAAPTATASGEAKLTSTGHTVREIEINDLPQNVRLKVNGKRYMSSLENEYRVSITVKGNFVPPGRPLGVGEKKLTLCVEAHDPQAVLRAFQEIQRQIGVEASKMSFDQAASSAVVAGRYRI